MKASDHSILCKLSSSPVDEIKIPIITASYAEYKELCKEHITWFKHYFIALALLLLSYLKVIEEFEIFGAKISSSFFPFTALLYSTVSIIVYTNFELKMRVYRSVYSNELENLIPEQRLAVLMRFPFAFSGPEYIVPNIIIKTYLISGFKQMVSHLSLVMMSGMVIIVFSIIMLLNWVAIYEIILLEKYGAIRYIVPAAWLIAWIFSLTILRNIKNEYLYEARETNNS